MDQEFYIILPSNTLSDAFPKNKTSHYSIGLPTHLELGTFQWEVSLVSISYPHTWYNVEVSDAYIDLYIESRKIRRRFAPGYYNSGQEIVDRLNTVIERFSSNYTTRFSYDQQSNKVTVTIGDDERVKLPKGLSALLGFHIRDFNFNNLFESTIRASNPDNPLRDPNEPRPPLPPRQLTADNGVDLSLKTHNIFVYTNIIKDTLVGNVYMPLLRTVSTRDENRGTYVSMNYIDRHYLPLSSNYIKQITIDIRDDQADNVRFQSGKVTVKLHFRVKK